MKTISRQYWKGHFGLIQSRTAMLSILFFLFFQTAIRALEEKVKWMCVCVSISFNSTIDNAYAHWTGTALMNSIFWNCVWSHLQTVTARYVWISHLNTLSSCFLSFVRFYLSVRVFFVGHTCRPNLINAKQFFFLHWLSAHDCTRNETEDKNDTNKRRNEY